jgi:fumarate reductase subunit C
MRKTELTRTTDYTPYHPRWYRQRVSTYWWLGQWPYLRFVLRELSSIFVAAAVVGTLWLVRALSAGPEAYEVHLARLSSPGMVAWNLVVLFFVLFHTITWFNAAPRAMALRLGGRRVPDRMVALAHYVGWLAVSGAVAWFVLRAA